MLYLFASIIFLAVLLGGGAFCYSMDLKLSFKETVEETARGTIITGVVLSLLMTSLVAIFA